MAMWPDDEQHDGRIDAAIDEVARRMTAGSPDSAFKARVLARIDGDRLALRDPSASRGWRLAWMLAPLVVAALIIITIAVFRASNRQSRSAPDVAQRPSPAETVTPAGTARDRGLVKDGTAAPRTTETLVQRAQAPLGPAMSRRLPRARAESSEVDALAPSPLEVDSIRLAALPPASSIRLAPLEPIAPIDVAPLGEPDHGSNGESQRR